MIGIGTKVNVVDNSGAILGKCIRILHPKSSKGRRVGHIGSVIIITVLQTVTGSKIKKGELFKALIVQTKKEEPMSKLQVTHGASRHYTSKISEHNNAIDVADAMHILEVPCIGRKTNLYGYRRKYSENNVVLIKTGSGHGSNKSIGDWTPIGSRIKKGKISDIIEKDKRCSKIISIC